MLSKLFTLFLIIALLFGEQYYASSSSSPSEDNEKDNVKNSEKDSEDNENNNEINSENNDKNNEKYIIILDAGSTGSRIYIFKYDISYPLESIVEIAHKRVNPALSSFVNDSIGLSIQLNSLIAFAKTITPEYSWKTTNISLKATAGLRSLKIEDQNFLIHATNNVLNVSGFLSDTDNTKVITGEEEALFDILSVTTLFQIPKDGFVSLGEYLNFECNKAILYLFNYLPL